MLTQGIQIIIQLKLIMVCDFTASAQSNVLRISVGRGSEEMSGGEEAATQFSVGLSRVRDYLEFE